jgi:type II secretory pathway component PulF
MNLISPASVVMAISVSAMGSGGFFFSVVWTVLIYVVMLFVPLALIIFAAYFLVSLPLRRQERARFFLELLETALNRGGALEQQLISMSESRDRAPGVRFHLLAAHLANGLRLGAALDRVPRLVLPRIAAMLKAGERLGDLRKVLPACRQLTRDAISQTRSGVHYLCVVVFIVTPVVMLILASVITVVVPKFREVFAGMTETTWPLFDALVASRNVILAGESCVIAGTLLAVFFYVGGPRAVGWTQRATTIPLADWFAWHVPWKRKRMQRDFAMMLSILLDSGVPEPDAVKLAADCTANKVFARRAGRVVGQLAVGVKLTEAVAALDDAGEFRWRLTNARPARGGFLAALTGWCEALDAKAFQQEQAAAQLATSGLVLFNGAIVAFIAIACFGALVQIVKEGVLW